MSAISPNRSWTLLTFHVGNNPGVDKLARTTLAANLNAAIKRSGQKTRNAWALSKKLDVKAVERAAKGLHAPRLDFVEELAAACDLQPWQLLHPEGPGAGTGLSPEALEIARRLDRITDPKWHKYALAACRLAVFTGPVDEAENPASDEAAGQAPRPTPAPQKAP